MSAKTSFTRAIRTTNGYFADNLLAKIAKKYMAQNIALLPKKIVFFVLVYTDLLIL